MTTKGQDAMPRTGRPATRHVAAVERAVLVLEALSAAETAVGTNEIARRTGINASSVSRLLATLVKAGMVEHVADSGRYRLGLRMLQFGNAVLARLDLREVARVHLRALVRATGETATLSIPGGDGEALTVDFVQSDSSVQSVAHIGRPSVAHATAVGKVMLASSGQHPDRPLPRFTGTTITDHAALRREVAQTSERGWGQALGEREDDLHAVAVPVCRSDGSLLAILGVQGPAGRFGDEERAAAVRHLLAAAAEIEATFAGQSA